MTDRDRKAPPAFWRQGLLILLPVVLLAGLGLFFIARDHRSVEQQARERAREVVQAHLAALAHFGATLDKIYTSPGAPSNPRLEFSESGERVWPPVDWLAPPVPPNWFVELTENQRNLWLTALDADLEDQSPERVIASWQAFIADDPSDEARANAEWFLLRQKHRASELDSPGDRFAEFALTNLMVKTETGLSLSAVAVGEALTAAESRGSIEPIFRAVSELVFTSPSILTPHLLEQAARVFKTSPVGGLGDSESSLKGLRNAWDDQLELVRLAEAVEPAVANQLQASNYFWWEFEGESYLLEILKRDTRPEAATAKHREILAERNLIMNQRLPGAFGVFVHHWSAVQSACDQMVRESGQAIPPYLAIQLHVQDRLIWSSTAANGAPNEALFAASADPFTASAWIADASHLYAQQRQRALWLVGVILVATIAAGIGFEQARRAFLRQLRLAEMKSNFVSSVSHELRAPIASVRLMAEGLESGRVSESAKQREYFRFIVQECRRLSALIENVLDFARIEQRRKEYDFEPTDLAVLVRETTELMSSYGAERAVTIECDIAASGGATELLSDIFLDGRAIQQALVNLIDNAIKHSPPGSRVIVGLTVTEHNPTLVQLWVEDQGAGIPAADHERIFERFYRRGSELRRETAGVGIGLSIVKHVAEAHGGRVLLRSAPGQGSRFTLELPLRRVSQVTGS